VNTSNLSLVPLRQASLCLDCETITSAQTNCHACGSRALLNVARALDRQRPSDLACSARIAAVQMSVPRKAQRDTPYRRTPSLDRNRGREGMLPLRIDLSMSENSA
jgi:hypothetical protein